MLEVETENELFCFVRQTLDCIDSPYTYIVILMSDTMFCILYIHICRAEPWGVQTG